MADESLIVEVKLAIRESVNVLCLALGAPEISGYALLTDDNLSTLGCSVVTKDYLEEVGGLRECIEPVDWPHFPKSAAMDSLGRKLGELSAQTSPEQNVSFVGGVFNDLVKALMESRDDGLFTREAFLTVLSTDPSEYLEILERGAVKVLNSEDVYALWLSIIEGG